MSKELETRLVQEFGLSKEEDIHAQRSKAGKLLFWIINRKGIDKIEAKLNLDRPVEIEFIQNERVWNDSNKRWEWFILAAASYDKYIMYGEVNPYNITNNYPFATAEKRARSRLILKMAGLYKEGVMSEDEMDGSASMQIEKQKITNRGVSKANKAKEALEKEIG